MWFSSLLARRQSNSRRSTRHTRRSTKARLSIEALDHRAVPAFLSAGASAFAGELLKVGDFNNDGVADLVSNGPGAAVSVRLGNGDGSFGAAQSSIASVTGTSPARVVVGDINRDGNLDVVTGSSGSQSDFSVLLGNGEGTFALHRQYALPGFQLTGIAGADLDNDNDLDLVTSEYLPGTGWAFPQYRIRTLLGDGQGNYLQKSSQVGTSFALGDFNSDGRLDLFKNVLTGFFPGRYVLSLHSGNGDGTFQASSTWSLQGPQSSPAIGQINSDGKLDILVQGTLYLGNGDGTFQNFGPTPEGLPQADFNGDGKLDLAQIWNEGTSYINIYPGNGDGTFQPVQHSRVGPIISGSAVSDFNGDGRPDFAVTHSPQTGTHILEVLLNDGNENATPLPSVRITDVSMKEGVKGTTLFTFTVTLSVPSAEPVTLKYATGDGTASAGQDYTAASGTLTFAAGETSKIITIQVKGDRIKETNETFYLDLSDVFGALFEDSQGVGNILNDD